MFGREADRASVEAFLDGLAAGSAGLVVAGEAGIGKTTLWQEALEGGRQRGFRVMVARPAESEARLSYSGLGDLLESVADDVLPALPEPQRRALEIALLKARDDGDPPDQRAVSVAVVSALRLLAATAPVVVAIDDVQWLDQSSARVLKFAVRRMGPAQVGFVVALRLASDLVEPLDLRGGGSGMRVGCIDIGPMRTQVLDQVVHAQLGERMARSMLLRVHRASGGNPFYALELARALRVRETELAPGEPLPVPPDLQTLVEERLRGLPDEVRTALEVVAAVSQPTTALLASVLGPRAGGGVRAGVDAGLIRAEGGSVRLAHPLLGSVAYGRLPPKERRRLHRRIAAAVGDPEERARHLALGSSGPDAEVAVALDKAAGVAASRGAPAAAAELCELACRFSPAASQDRARVLAIDAAMCHYAAGDSLLAQSRLMAIAAASSPGPERADTLSLLGELRFFNDSRDSIRLLEEALAQAGDDDRLLASIELSLGHAIITTSGDLAAATVHSANAVHHAERFGEPGLVAAALAVAGYVDYAAGRAGAEDTMMRAVAIEDPGRPHVIITGPSILAARAWMWTDRHQEAGAAFDRCYRMTVRRGALSALPLVGFFAAYFACWTGDLDGAAGYARTSLEAAADVESDVSRAAGLSAQAMVDGYFGDAPAARSQAREATTLFQRSGWMIASIWPTWILGVVELSLGDPAAAHLVLGPISELAVARGLAQPSVMAAVSDDIEALVALGNLDESDALLQWFEERSRCLDQAWTLAASGRCRAALLAARGDLDRAAAVIEAAFVQYDRIPFPVELGRTLLVKGQIERRCKHKAVAKRVLDESVAVFETVGASLWARRARGELSRVGLRPPAPLHLTATEALVAELVAAGLTTRQVAEQAFMSPRTVEGVLARVYRKLGVTSRVQLVMVMATFGTSAPNRLTSGRVGDATSSGDF
jgi:DNA-binding CsgD family transcriptional regulator